MPENNRITQYFGHYYCEQRQLTEYIVVDRGICIISDYKGISMKNKGNSNFSKEKSGKYQKMYENPIIPVQSRAPGFFV